MSWIPEQWERRKSWKDLNAAGSNPLVRESERERERERETERVLVVLLTIQKSEAVASSALPMLFFS